METTRAVLFDAYGTLFGVCSLGLLGEQLFPDQGARLVTVWRDKQTEYTRLVTTCCRLKNWAKRPNACATRLHDTLRFLTEHRLPPKASHQLSL